MLFISVRVIPAFSDIFHSFNMRMPAVTEFVLTAGAIYPYVFAVIWGLALIFAVVAVVLHLNGHGSVLIDTAFIRVPLVGPALRTLARMYQRQAEHRLRVLPTVITPVLLIVMAGTVMTTIAGMILPLTKLLQSVSGGDG